jgi:Flp pilus assembly pilin Flp
MKEFNNFLMDEDGMGVVEVILIIVILISLALLFKEQITDLVDKILQKITKQAGKVYK